MKIDFHVHSAERSGCGKSSETAQVEAAIAVGLDAIVFTDHFHLVPGESLACLNRRYAPFRVFGGVEVRVDGEDVLVLGIQDQALECEGWDWPQLHAWSRRREGAMILAHPFRYQPEIQLDIRRFPPDAIEICSHNTPPREFANILEVARRLDIPTVSNSDSHQADAFGHHYNLFDPPPQSERDLIDRLKRGDFSCVVPESLAAACAAADSNHLNLNDCPLTC